MKTLFYLAVVVIIWLAFNGGLKWCYKGSIWFIPQGCHEFRLEAIQK